MTTLATLVQEADLEQLRLWLAGASTLDIARELERLPPSERGIPFRLLPKDRALRVFEALDPAHQQELLSALREGTALELIERMDPDDRAELLDEMPAKVAKRLLAGLSPRERQLTATLLGYPEQSAGRIMSPEYVALRATMTAAQAIARIRAAAPPPGVLSILPVIDDERRLVGNVELARLVLASDDTRLADLMTSEALHVRVDADREVAARLIQDAGLLALPVVDREDRLVGVVTIDDAMEVLEAEAAEDHARAGGAEPLRRPYLTVSVARLARSRALWLLALVVAATLTVNVLHVFQGALEAAVTLALFIPLLIGTGGNAGAQSATTLVRAIAVGDVTPPDFGRVLLREAGVGFVLGAMLAGLAWTPVAWLFGSDIATVVATTLVVICTLASLTGALLPIVAWRTGVDPAVASAPIVTTLIDATGLLVYFVLARSILGI